MVGEPADAARLRAQVSDSHRHLLSQCTAVAAELESRLFLVGGGVRDWLLTDALRDLDLLVEGDAARFARLLAARLAVEVHVHERFGTAELWFGDQRLDLSSARRETYPAPAALPAVAPGTVEQDLARRDFTVNAMALELWPDANAELLDPHGGRADLRRRVLRVLHDGSFVDDPTRILRGVRLGARLGFRMAPGTEELAAGAIRQGAFRFLTASRLGQELRLLLGEEESVDGALARLTALDFWRVLHPDLEVDSQRLERCRALTALRAEWESAAPRRPRVDWWRARLMVLVRGRSRQVAAAVARRLDLAGAPCRRLANSPALLDGTEAALLEPQLPPHRAATALRPLGGEELAVLARSPHRQVADWIERWLSELRGVRLGISGADLVERGFAPGPEIGEALAATLAARLDGSIRASEELGHAVRCLAGLRSHDRRPRAEDEP